MSETLLPSVLKVVDRKLAGGSAVKRAIFGLLTAGAGFIGHTQLQHNADMDRRVGSLETVTANLRAQAAATGANVAWLVTKQGGQPRLAVGGTAPTMEPRLGELREPTPLPEAP